MSDSPDYLLNIGTLTVVLDTFGGRYVSRRSTYDLVLSWSSRRLRERWEDVHDGNESENGPYRKAFLKLPKHARAAMVAEWEGFEQ